MICVRVTYGTHFMVDDKGSFQRLHIFDGLPFCTDTFGAIFSIFLVESRTLVIGNVLNTAVGKLRSISPHFITN